MKKIESHLIAVEQINAQRVVWLIVSIIIYSIILIIAIASSIYTNSPFSIALWITGASVTGVWWIWTMYIIKTLLAHRQTEFYILQDIIIDLRETKKLTKELFDHSTEP